MPHPLPCAVTDDVLTLPISSPLLLLSERVLSDLSTSLGVFSLAPRSTRLTYDVTHSKSGILSFWNDNISYTLRGCIVMELALRHRIAVIRDPNRRRFPLADRYVAPSKTWWRCFTNVLIA